MQQYFVNQSLTLQKPIVLDENQAHHIINVIRMKDGQTVRLSDTKQVYLAQLSIEGKQVIATPISQVLTASEFKQPITLLVCLLKGDKFEWVIQKATELGVSRIVPVISRRTIVKWKDNADKKLKRYQTIMMEAAEQSLRQSYPTIVHPITMDHIGLYRSQQSFIAYENEVAVDFNQNTVVSDQPISILVGPEGGFEAFEVELAQSQGFRSCSLGNRILRAETASIYMLSVLNMLIE